MFYSPIYDYQLNVFIAFHVCFSPDRISYILWFTKFNFQANDSFHYYNLHPGWVIGLFVVTLINHQFIFYMPPEQFAKELRPGNLLLIPDYNAIHSEKSPLGGFLVRTYARVLRAT